MKPVLTVRVYSKTSISLLNLTEPSTQLNSEYVFLRYVSARAMWQITDSNLGEKINPLPPTPSNPCLITIKSVLEKFFFLSNEMQPTIERRNSPERLYHR